MYDDLLLGEFEGVEGVELAIDDCDIEAILEQELGVGWDTDLFVDEDDDMVSS